MSPIGSRYTLRPFRVLLVALSVAMLLPLTAQAQTTPATCNRTLIANVVSLDQPFFLNRLGALESTGMIFALKRDVVPITGTTLSAGNVQLRSDKRPRPLVLRMNVGDCLQINFQNLLAPTRKDEDQVNTRNASIHVIGMQLVGSIASDGSFAGANASSLVAPGGSATYTLFAQREGGHVMAMAGSRAQASLAPSMWNRKVRAGIAARLQMTTFGTSKPDRRLTDIRSSTTKLFTRLDIPSQASRCSAC
jgi:hypothetical protein